ncbi:MAG: class I SAM-dependent methyltransferase [Desulfobacterales bacterium]|nr:class I SAM-dependent methyltransferase [Desulfobacterales bacterium]
MTYVSSTIKWKDVWADQLQAHNRIIPMDCPSKWNSKASAEKFWEITRKNNEKRLNKTLEGFELDSTARVLDVGAGPGNLTIPCAKRFSHVTAVEPARGMMDLLIENADKEKIKNITPVQKKWEAFDLVTDLGEPCDLVIASFSLGMSDMEAAVLKMAAASSKYICLLWFAGEPEWEKHSRILWTKLHNLDYVPMPKVDVLFNLLYQMGIHPEMAVFPLSSETVFSSFRDAVRHFSTLYRVDDPGREKILADYLEQTLEPVAGKWVQKNNSTRVKLWWSK